MVGVGTGPEREQRGPDGVGDVAWVVHVLGALLGAGLKHHRVGAAMVGLCNIWGNNQRE